jgi:hypothetical protein
MARGAPVYKNIAGLAITAGTPQNVWTPTAGTKFRLVGYSLGLSVAGSVILKEGAGRTEVIRTATLVAGDHETERLGEGILSAAADNILKVDASASGTVHGHVWGYEE